MLHFFAPPSVTLRELFLLTITTSVYIRLRIMDASHLHLHLEIVPPTQPHLRSLFGLAHMDIAALDSQDICRLSPVSRTSARYQAPAGLASPPERSLRVPDECQGQAREKRRTNMFARRNGGDDAYIRRHYRVGRS